MIKPVQMCSWCYDKASDSTIKTVHGWLPGNFNEDGLLIGVLPNAFTQPVATPELAMEMVNQNETSQEPS